MAESALAETKNDSEPAGMLATPDSSLASDLRMLLKPLASLKLTVALFAMAIFIVFAGTLAQVDKDIWDAINGYFRTPIAWIEFQIFFPPSFFPSKPKVPGGFPFPGGWLIGLAMVINLLAAHGLRFKVQAGGSRLIAGLATIAVGVLITWLVIVSGSNADGLQHEYWISWGTLWTAFKVGIGVLWIASIFGWQSLLRNAESERWLAHSAGAVPVVLAVLLGWLLFSGDSVRLDDSGMRILWQLIKGAFAGLVLLAGSVMVFKKRAGIVLLHSGVLLMMFSELLVGTTAKEGQMQIREGETVNYVQDIRSVELAIIDRADDKIDDVVAIPQSMLRQSKPIVHQLLPCQAEVIQYFRNSRIHDVVPGEENPADTGAGQTIVAAAATRASGTDADSKVDLASAYVKFSRTDGSPIGTYLLSQFLDEQPLEIGEKKYDVVLRFKRTYKPFQVTLLDVRKDDYLGTDTARNYSSDVHLVDATRGVDRKIKIWMNNPLRFAGETFYQSSYNLDPRTGAEITGLAVVTNTGWMIPYVGCMIVAVGMLAHFGVVLLRFLNRRMADQAAQAETARQQRKVVKSKPIELPPIQSGEWPEVAVRFMPIAIVTVFAIWLASQAQPPRARDGEMNVYEFGKLPLVEQGRVKPFDTFARNTLRMISERQSFKDENGKTQTATRWLLDVIAKPDVADKYAVFRIENMEVLDTLGLTRRKGLRYSVDDMRPKSEEFNKQAEQARSTPPKELSLYQRKVMDLDRRVRTYTLLQASFHSLPFPAMPSEKEIETDREGAMKRLMRIRDMLEAATRLDGMMASMHPPLAVPVEPGKGDAEKRPWKPYSTAVADAYKSTILGERPNASAVALTNIFDAYAADDWKNFNAEVAGLHATIADRPPIADMVKAEPLDVTKTNFEAYYNFVQLPLNASFIYLFGFILSCLAWLGWSGPLSRSALWLNAFTLAIHTVALIARIYISGRPPVTNLYSSAVFIGWAGVLLGLVLEVVFRLGIGNVVSAVAGASTLFIAHSLAGDGDTFTVLVAVLDTQFWLATHVVCITLGYATTFVAGLLGIQYVVLGLFPGGMSPERSRTHTRMIYGILSFALFFSFVGTVLGGLWADDSWGRFWGWDPKENGALIIVLWNALVMHARWDGMVKERGLAYLAIGGNIVTSWSWFGVNELGVGLHSYGFTEGVLKSLGVFILSQLALIALGSMFANNGNSKRITTEDSAA